LAPHLPPRLPLRVARGHFRVMFRCRPTDQAPSGRPGERLLVTANALSPKLPDRLEHRVARPLQRLVGRQENVEN
jgi:hypothetical protein